MKQRKDRLGVKFNKKEIDMLRRVYWLLGQASEIEGGLEEAAEMLDTIIERNDDPEGG